MDPVPNLKRLPPFHLADVLDQYVSRSGYNPRQLAQLSAVPYATIVNWLEGRVKRPRAWSDLLKLAAVLHLNIAEANELLQSAGYPSVAELRVRAEPEAANLLTPWTETARGPIEPSPFQAIADLPYFVGREQALAALKQVLLDGQRVTICSLQGMGGVGKTALAAHLAYQLRDDFPDGVLWARVDVSDPVLILKSFALAYGHDLSAYPDVDSCGRVVRSILAYKRALIVLDNARSSDEVRPLLPPTGACAVIITTRRHDLSVARGAQRFFLGPFDREQHEALDLFTKLLGEGRTHAEQAMLLELADLLGHLPLAVAIAASRLAYEPGGSTADFLKRMYQAEGRLRELTHDDDSVRLSFTVGFGALTGEQQQLFVNLGAFGGEFSVEAVAHVDQTSIETARARLSELRQLSLVEQGRWGRYRLHPLLHDYAREKLQDNTVFQRMVEYFVDYVEGHRANAAIDLEIGNLLTALETIFTREMPAELVGRFTLLLERYQAELGQRDYALAEERLAQARLTQEHKRIIIRLSDIGALALARQNYAAAQQHLQEAVALALETGYRPLFSLMLRNLGESMAKQGHFVQAETYLRDALALAYHTGHSWSIGMVLETLGDLHLEQGQLDPAANTYSELLTLARQLGDHEWVANAVYGLARVAAARNDVGEARQQGQASLTLFESFGHPRANEVAQWMDELPAHS